jgi:hypothetical protein
MRVEHVIGCEPSLASLIDPEPHKIQIRCPVSVRRNGEFQPHIPGGPRVNIVQVEPADGSSGIAVRPHAKLIRILDIEEISDFFEDVSHFGVGNGHLGIIVQS